MSRYCSEMKIEGYHEASREELRIIQLAALKKVADFCEGNNLKYCIIFGTLLGAVRHKGYIPWDDDIDVCMLRSDYDVFVKKFSSDENDFYVLSGEINKDYPYIMAKVCKKDTILYEEISGMLYEMGIGIDIFPLDSIPDDSRSKKNLLRYVKKRLYLSDLQTIVINKKRAWYKNAAVILLRNTICHKPVARLCREIEEKVKKEMQPDSKLVGVIIISYQDRAFFERKDFEDTSVYEFEGLQLMGPKNHDAVLEHTYGEYMKLPPVEEQVAHHDYFAYVKNV